jgi:hypothetical protein
VNERAAKKSSESPRRAHVVEVTQVVFDADVVQHAA